MALVKGSSEFDGKLADVLGLPRSTTEISITVKRGALVEVSARMLLDEKQGLGLIEVLRHYRIEEVKG